MISMAIATPFLLHGGITLGALLIFAAFLHIVGRLGPAGVKLADRLCRGIGLDLVVTYFTAAPWIVGYCLRGWWGVLAAVLAQILAVMIWTVLHELANWKYVKPGRARIVHSLNKSVGRVRNHTAVWWTAWAVPVFWVIRVAEYFVYPPLIWLVRFPRYDQNQWVNVSRQKFKGLVGHDLIWCLYCDWMTGVWSLGGEMLRNVESFWCPIKYDSAKKCANCKVDFPDIEGGWVPASADIEAAAAVIEEKYPKGQKVNAWFGHPVRLTVEGEERRGE